ncbi:MAG: hypothetical protein Q8J97_16825, partial [Flavobacteriaceae bacterium]|nr:hypothetical protein [Flavobacteriaceae bacterium]
MSKITSFVLSERARVPEQKPTEDERECARLLLIRCTPLLSGSGAATAISCLRRSSAIGKDGEAALNAASRWFEHINSDESAASGDDTGLVAISLIEDARQRGIPVPASIAVCASRSLLRGRDQQTDWSAAAAVFGSVAPADATAKLIEVCGEALLRGRQWDAAARLVELGARRGLLPPSVIVEQTEALSQILGSRHAVMLRDAAHGATNISALCAAGHWVAAARAFMDCGRRVTEESATALLRAAAEKGRLRLSVMILLHLSNVLRIRPTAIHFNAVLSAAAQRDIPPVELVDSYKLLRRFSQMRVDDAVRAFVATFALELDVGTVEAQVSEATHRHTDLEDDTATTDALAVRDLAKLHVPSPRRRASEELWTSAM